MTGLITASCATPHMAGERLPELEQVIPAERLVGPTLATADQADLIEAPGIAHFLRGLFFFKNESLNLALDELKLALIYFPDSPYLHEQLSEVWAAMGDDAKQKITLRSGLKKKPDSPLLNHAMGVVLHDDMLFGEAAKYLGRASKSTIYRWKSLPWWFSAQLWLGKRQTVEQAISSLLNTELPNSELLLRSAEIFEEHGLYQDALNFYEKASVDFPKESAALFGRMRIQLFLGNVDEAVSAISPMYLYPSNSIVISSLISQILAYGGHLEADAYRQEALRQSYGDEKALVHIASDDFASGRVAEAFELIDSLLKRNSEFEEARLVAARMHANKSDYSKCLRYLERPGVKNREFNLQRALCWGGLGDTESMLGEFAFAYNKGSRLNVVLDGAAYWLARRSTYTEAMNRFESFCLELTSHVLSKECVAGKAAIADYYGRGPTAIALMEDFQFLSSGEHSDWKIRLADMLCRYGREQEGVRLLEQLVRHKPYDLKRLNALGFRLVEADQSLEQASIWLHRAYRLNPHAGFVVDSVGRLLYKQGRYEQALIFARMAVFRNPNDPEILRHLGDVLLKLNQRVEAHKAFESALMNFPTLELKNKLRARLESLQDGS